LASLAPAPITNRLLDRLPARDRAQVLGSCEKVALFFPEILAEPGDPVRHIYFPTGSCISLLTPIGAKNTVEVALVGSEGVYGVPVALGVGFSPIRAQVQGSGPAWRMSAPVFRRELERVPNLRRCIDRYIFVLISQVSQTAGCNTSHRTQQRLARCMLKTADRAHSSTFRITHEFLACMLGVRREAITQAAGALQRRKLISYGRGLITILDRKGLERASCPCYHSDLSTYQRIFR